MGWADNRGMEPTPQQLQNRKLFKYLIAGCLATFGSCVGTAIWISSQPKIDQDASLSPADWRAHKQSLDQAIDEVSKTRNIHQMNRIARTSVNLKYIDSCNYSGCSEMRHYLNAIVRATDDGTITPKEAADIRDDARLYRQEVLAAGLKISQRLPAGSGSR